MHYSLVFEINSPKINSETATDTPESSANSVLREMVTNALREEASLPIDLDSLTFNPGTILTFMDIMAILCVAVLPFKMTRKCKIQYVTLVGPISINYPLWQDGGKMEIIYSDSVYASHG